MRFIGTASLVLLILLGAATASAQFDRGDPYLALRDSLREALGATQILSVDDQPNLGDLHGWFDRSATGLVERHYGSRQVVPLGIYRAQGVGDPRRLSRWNFGLEYQMPLKTLNGVFNLLTLGLSEKADFSLKLLYGSGIDAVDDNIDEIGTNIGLSGEIDFSTASSWINPLFGIGYSWASPETGADGQSNFLYAGNRIFLTGSRWASLDLKGGFAMWRGFDDNEPADWFASAGLTLHRTIDLTPAGSPLFGPMEVAFETSTLKASGSRVSAPIRLTQGLSIAPYFGYNIGHADRLKSMLNFGAELRLFGDVYRPAPSFNPYLGVQRVRLDYKDDVTQPDQANGTQLFFGGRLYLNDRVGVDLALGPCFWGDEYKDHPSSEPADWAGRIGVTAAFGRVEVPRRLRGSVLTVENARGETRFDAFEPLQEQWLGLRDGEVRVYALEELALAGTDTITITETVRDTLRITETVTVGATSIGDLSDLKFFSVELDLDIGFTPFNSKASLISGGENTSTDVMIAVLFDKRRTSLSQLNERNTFFHFVDYDNGQYFGYRWDANRNRQPEFRTREMLGRIPDTGGRMYWGHHDDFVKPLRWLDGGTVLDFIEGDAIQSRLLELMDRHFAENDTLYRDVPTPERLRTLAGNYRIAYVQYPASTVDRIREFMPHGNFGVAVMIGQDVEGDGLFRTSGQVEWAEPQGRPEGLADDAKVSFDSGDNFFFSNPVRVEEIITQDLLLSGFEECEAVLLPEHEDVLRRRVLSRMWASPDERVRLIGWTDATPMTPDCRGRYPDTGQRGLAEARAEAARDFLIRNGIEAGRVEAVGRGVKTRGRFRWIADRCVEVEFLGAE